MRTLELNKTKLWYVEPIGEQKEIDEEGFHTGEIIFTYSNPVEIKIALYPSTGKITETIFGKNASFDMIATTNDLDLKEGTLLFYNEPTGDYDKTYDFTINAKKKSINTIVYGFKGRI